MFCFDIEIKATITEIYTPKLEHLRQSKLFAWLHNYLKSIWGSLTWFMKVKVLWPPQYLISQGEKNGEKGPGRGLLKVKGSGEVGKEENFCYTI